MKNLNIESDLKITFNNEKNYKNMKRNCINF